MSKKTNNQTTTTNATETKATKAVAEKPVVPKFDKKAFGTELIKAFSKNDTVDMVFDTELEEGVRATNEPDYKYIHIFRKGTTKNCFQAYISSNGLRYVVGKNIDALIPENEKFVKEPVEKPKGSGKISYYNYRVAHENAVEVLTLLIDTYKQFNATKAEEKANAEKAVAEAKEAKAQAKAQKQAEKEKAKAEKKPVAEKPKTEKKPAKKTKTA